jgi:hypothetical protein
VALAADGQRERTVAVLRRAYLEGRLRSEEFAERTGRALAARTTAELRELVRDLPWLAEVAGRAARYATLAVIWLVGSIVLCLAFVAALLPGGMSGTEALVFPLAWAILTAGAWRAARRR